MGNYIQQFIMDIFIHPSPNPHENTSDVDLNAPMFMKTKAICVRYRVCYQLILTWDRCEVNFFDLHSKVGSECWLYQTIDSLFCYTAAVFNSQKIADKCAVYNAYCDDFVI